MNSRRMFRSLAGRPRPRLLLSGLAVAPARHLTPGRAPEYAGAPRAEGGAKGGAKNRSGVNADAVSLVSIMFSGMH
jgi:hypothetical protein